MSVDPGTVPEPFRDRVAVTYEDLLEMAEEGLEECLRKIESGRVYEVENEKARQGWHNSACRYIKEMRLLLAAIEEQNHEARLEALERELGIAEE